MWFEFRELVGSSVLQVGVVHYMSSTKTNYYFMSIFHYLVFFVIILVALVDIGILISLVFLVLYFYRTFTTDLPVFEKNLS